ncbi:3-dehydroquinate synthase [Mucispirillum schaedleri]|jgi:3-dehydroquinate synthase|uniref:3-dehydroquinate synthase n=1 Tax=Mucispirillum schaedleri ASF457 TaxID=1379858 RepID=V2RLV0_9BACT|nr:3-dehydroquinate synthase [Mucispirillum schaedleri]MCX4360862.1 3-dehydroquinate synthase [Mucispirillum schaedleri]USF24098.1 3-dehydroquinate synthase [Mucispirillum schaedleri ASF457]SIW06240.1 3-dehydroquinate synthase [Mucispirillum schaedleri ASF457]
MKSITVNILENKTNYNIFIGSDFIGDKLAKYEKDGAYFIIDSKVASLYKNIIPKERVFLFQAAEKNKTFLSLEKMLDFLRQHNALRDSTLVSVGGGITGDVAAFAASVYMRGIKLIQVPTTLLAMVDSSVGGKTAVNFKGIKNNIGSFYQPGMVLIDSNFLDSLTDKEYLNGLVESIKIAAIRDKEFFEYINANKSSILKRSKAIMEYIIAESCRLKAEIVEQDEKEAGIRKLLNFGHTAAHGIESDSNYKIHHGFAVALGMIYESKYALQNGYTDKETYEAVYGLLKSLKYPTHYEPKDIDKMLEAVSKDKKAGKNGISVAFSGKNMQGIIINDIKPKELIDLFL